MPELRRYGGMDSIDLPFRRMWPAVGRLETGEHHQSGRLCRSRWPKQREEFTLGDREVELIDDVPTGRHRSCTRSNSTMFVTSSVFLAPDFQEYPPHPVHVRGALREV